MYAKGSNRQPAQKQLIEALLGELRSASIPVYSDDGSSPPPLTPPEMLDEKVTLYNDYPALFEGIESQPRGTNLWFYTAPCIRDIYKLTAREFSCVWLSVEYEVPEEIEWYLWDTRWNVDRYLDQLACTPSARVYTNTGTDAYWLLDRPIYHHIPLNVIEWSIRWLTTDIRRKILAEDIPRDLAQGKARVFERYMKLPGTYDYQGPASPRLITVDEMNLGNRYSLDELTRMTRDLTGGYWPQSLDKLTLFPNSRDH